MKRSECFVGMGVQWFAGIVHTPLVVERLGMIEKLGWWFAKVRLTAKITRDSQGVVGIWCPHHLDQPRMRVSYWRLRNL